MLAFKGLFMNHLTTIDINVYICEQFALSRDLSDLNCEVVSTGCFIIVVLMIYINI